jgi:hypothetical protein
MGWRGLTVIFAVTLAPSCLGQMNGGPYVLSQILSEAQVSGSLSYWGPGPCSSDEGHYPLAPPLRRANSSGPVLEVLQEMFAGDPKMRVTQEPGGVVRMSETDVPRDLLDVKIHHISFDPPPGAGRLHGPNMALKLILSSPEVQAFRKVHKIGPFSDVFLMPSDAGSDRPSVSGHLEDVTVSQALDYIFKTFPGFWIYGNCPSERKGEERNVYFSFYENDPTQPSGSRKGGN